MEKIQNTSWELPPVPDAIENGPGRTETDLQTRERLAREVAGIATKNGWSKAETARQMGLAGSLFSQWLSAKYPGRFDTINEKVQNWLDLQGEVAEAVHAIPKSPEYIELSISNQIQDFLQSAQVMPTMVMICCEAGLGKTMAAKHYHQTRANTFYVTISPIAKTVHGSLMEIANGVGLTHKNSSTIAGAIGERVERKGAGTLLIIDEAQNLLDDAINQARHFVDNYGCGVALLGNTETYSRFSDWSQGPRYAQLRRRIFRRMRKVRPNKNDLVKFIKACGIEGKAEVEFLTGVGMKPGAFGQIDMTVRLAKIMASGAGRNVRLSDLKAAWSDRNVGDM